MLAIYTITKDGSSNGNIIKQPFTIEVHDMYYKGGKNNRLDINSCTKNGSDFICVNDDVSDSLSFKLPSLSSSKVTDLEATFEAALTAAYGKNWSKIN